jgi:hypothetical protein
MRKIKIKNFGPIKEGLVEGDGFLEVRKVTVFTGNQATGKSTVAKLISVFSWIEKALFRGTISLGDVWEGQFEGKYCSYQGLRSYFKADSEIEYVGDIYKFHYKNGSLGAATHSHNPLYKMPKIMYVPAERNFLSCVSRPSQLRGLPSPVYTFLEEFELAQENLIHSIPLPIGGIQFQYQKSHKIALVKGDGYIIRLMEASSGLQSSIPLYLVSRNLALSIQKQPDETVEELSLEDNIKLRQELQTILLDESLSPEIKRSALELLTSRYKNGCFLNIVEEMEQNLYPTSQMSMLFSLLEFVNYTDGNGLVMTTHSPYLINYLTLAIKGNEISDLIHKQNGDSLLLDELSSVVPLNALIASKDAIVYEFREDGTIGKLETYNGLPSDRNFLNAMLEDGNKRFDQLLDIQEKL